ncbi:MAG: hypothetical protein II453_02990 [Alphaproteobacteria bacterium]|nr:hypothetical protein [Alphaproteobacteria bacterium]MBQ2395824.1 hypothetical protein [Bacteroidales bacterium]
MVELIYILTALQIYCKDAHYSFSGVDFKPLHEWMDEIIDPLYDFIDDAKEKYYLVNELSVPRGTLINDEAKNFVPDALGSKEDILNNLLALISMAHNRINAINIKDAGINDLLGRIDTHLLHHIALLNLALKKDVK